MKTIKSNGINIRLPCCCKRDLNSDLDCAKLACYNLTRCSLATVRYCPPEIIRFLYKMRRRAILKSLKIMLDYIDVLNTFFAWTLSCLLRDLKTS